MNKYKVCLYVTTYTKQFITIDADNEETAEAAAMQIWYEDDRAFSAKLMDESVEDITTELEA